MNTFGFTGLWWPIEIDTRPRSLGSGQDMNVFDGLLGYEKLMLICGFILFVFALAAITVMIVQRRDFKMAMGLIVFAIVLMGFPGIQAVKFSQDTVELDRIRTQPQAPADPAQKQQAEQALANLEQRAVGNPRLQAQVSDGYRAIGEVDKAYRLAQSVLHEKPSAQVQATLVPVLTAKLNQVQAGAPIAMPAVPAASASSAMAATPAPAAAGTASSAPPPAAPVDKQREIAAIASQLQSTAAPLPAASHAALAKAYVVLGQPQRAQANVDAARRIDPNIRINAAVLRAARMGGNP
jgi:tetratricopeptide (TPR) repeat protein